MIRRFGTTLIEVLVAIFVTAIGLLGLLALFPLGAVNMAQAIKDSRCAQASATAFALFEGMEYPVLAPEGQKRIVNIRNDPLVVGDPGDVFVDADSNRPRADPDGPSYPVYVDPLGFASNSTPSNKYVGYGASGIPRRTMSFVKNLSTAIQWFSLLDDINFLKDGPYTGLACPPRELAPSTPGVGLIQREGRYSWAYLLRRPRSSDKSVVDVTVVVYNGRPTILGQGENVYGPVTFDPNSNLVRVYFVAGQEKPAVRPGGWILDATLVKGAFIAVSRASNQAPDPHGFFYRVVNVTDGTDLGRPYVGLELQTKPKIGTSFGVLVVLDGVAEVFEKGPGWRS
jgi:hypothetical protein